MARISARERRTIWWGVAVVTVALFVAWVVMPVARRWGAREDAIAAARDRVARLQGLLGRDLAVAPAGTPLVVRARTSDLAGPALMADLQELARASRVSVSRLEAVPDTTAPAAPALRASLSATTDIYGLADLLTRMQAHQPVLVLEELSLVPNPVLRGQLLQVTVGVRAPWVATP